MSACMSPRTGGIQILADQWLFPKELGQYWVGRESELDQKGFGVLSTSPTGVEVENPDMNVVVVSDAGGSELGHVVIVRAQTGVRFTDVPEAYAGYEPKNLVVEYWALADPGAALPAHFQLIDYPGSTAVPVRDPATGQPPALNQGTFAAAAPAAPDPLGGRLFEIWTGAPGLQTLVGWLHLPSADAADDHLELQRWYALDDEVVFDANTQAVLLPAATGVWDFFEIDSNVSSPWPASARFAQVQTVP